MRELTNKSIEQLFGSKHFYKSFACHSHNHIRQDRKNHRQNDWCEPDLKVNFMTNFTDYKPGNHYRKCGVDLLKFHDSFQVRLLIRLD